MSKCTMCDFETRSTAEIVRHQRTHKAPNIDTSEDMVMGGETPQPPEQLDDIILDIASDARMCDPYRELPIEMFEEQKKAILAWHEQELLKAVKSELELIVKPNFAPDFGTYDFDGIAEDTLKRIEQLNREVKK